ncbi:UNVERIFIED_CONTAM: hypothetical protein H355_001458 [Colinus virginianus]|nr:hypothetical protein H355_001458 [Colinus virginianus]
MRRLQYKTDLCSRSDQLAEAADIRHRTEELRKTHASALSRRRAALQDLFVAEEGQYQEELRVLKGQPKRSREQLMERTSQLLKQREEEKKRMAQELRFKGWIQSGGELKSADSKLHAMQVAVKEEQKRQDKGIVQAERLQQRQQEAQRSAQMRKEREAVQLRSLQRRQELDKAVADQRKRIEILREQTREQDRYYLQQEEEKMRLEEQEELRKREAARHYAAGYKELKHEENCRRRLMQEVEQSRNETLFVTPGLVNIFLHFSAGRKKYVAGLIIKTSSDPTCVEVSEFFQGRKREVNTAHNLTCLFHSPEREGVSWEAEDDSCSTKLEFINLDIWFY